jgi:hypothetical protein
MAHAHGSGYKYSTLPSHAELTVQSNQLTPDNPETALPPDKMFEIVIFEAYQKNGRYDAVFLLCIMLDQKQKTKPKNNHLSYHGDPTNDNGPATCRLSRFFPDSIAQKFASSPREIVLDLPK